MGLESENDVAGSLSPVQSTAHRASVETTFRYCYGDELLPMRFTFRIVGLADPRAACLIALPCLGECAGLRQRNNSSPILTVTMNKGLRLATRCIPHELAGYTYHPRKGRDTTRCSGTDTNSTGAAQKRVHFVGIGGTTLGPLALLAASKVCARQLVVVHPKAWSHKTHAWPCRTGGYLDLMSNCWNPLKGSLNARYCALPSAVRFKFCRTQVVNKRMTAHRVSHSTWDIPLGTFSRAQVRGFLWLRCVYVYPIQATLLRPVWVACNLGCVDHIAPCRYE
jgi:hypothetical protein